MKFPGHAAELPPVHVPPPLQVAATVSCPFLHPAPTVQSEQEPPEAPQAFPAVPGWHVLALSQHPPLQVRPPAHDDEQVCVAVLQA